MAAEKCQMRIVASWLPKDIICVRDKHTIGAHQNEDGKPFIVTTRPKPPPLRKRVVRKVVRKRVVRIKRR